MGSAGAAAGALRIGIVGLGQHAELLAKAIGRARGAALVAGASGSLPRAVEFGERFGVVGHGSYGALLDRDDVDLVVVSNANDRHREVVAEAFARGKHVLCEKPLALSTANAEAMAGAADAAGRSLFVGYHLRFLDIVAESRRRIAGGDVGAPLELRLSRASQFAPGEVRAWRQELGRAGGGVLCDVAPHLVDLVGHLTGEPIVAVHATARPERSSGIPDDRVVLTLSLGNGGVAVVTASRGVVGAESELHVHGSAGALCTSSLRWAQTHELRAIHAPGDGRAADRVVTAFDAGEPHVREIEAIVTALDGAQTPVARAKDGILGVRVLEAAIASLESGRMVALPPTRTQTDGV
jgi:1,5-anhydro-D-fructose reductase (1,5-anhydro-D-mannitol-forming)